MQIFNEILSVFISNWEVILLFFFIAMLYASVGFGGGSSYLAVLSLTSLAFTQFRVIALLCNLVVVSGGSYIFFKNNLFNWKKVVPLVLLSVPMSFIGGYISISQTFFFIILGITLLLASILMWSSEYISKIAEENGIKNSIRRDISYGGSIGFLSGMVGIGGGIFLAPLLHLSKWDTPKKIAATSSFFILVNSAAGLLGQFSNPDFSIEPTITIILLAIVFIGGQIGSRLSVRVISPINLKRFTALLIAYIALKLLLKHLI